MADPFIGEIRIFAGNFAPRDWALCNGQLIPIAQNTALFAIIGTIYGGDGRTDYALPNLQGRAPMHEGQGPGLTSRRLGVKSGSTTATLTTQQIGAHNHGMNGVDEDAASDNPANALFALLRDDGYGSGTPLAALHSDATTNTGGNGAHNNFQPYLVLNFIIALAGVFPT
jgi:microcystin-dependent protein